MRNDYSIAIRRIGLAFSAVWIACSGGAVPSEAAPAAVGRAAGAVQAQGKPLPRLAGAHHAVFSLVDNRLLAHLQHHDGQHHDGQHRGGFAIVGGTPGLAKYQSFGRPWPTWVASAREDGEPVSVAVRSVSWLSFPLTGEQARASTLTLRLKSPKLQGLRVRVNERALEQIRLAAGWQIANLPIPAGTLRAGENRLEFQWAEKGVLGGQKDAHAAIAWLVVGSESPAEGVRFGAATADGFRLPAGEGVAYYVFPYRDAKLSVRFGAQPVAERCTLRVTMGGGEGADRTVDLTAPSQTTGSVETFVDLAPVAERVARLELSAVGETCRELAVSQATIVMPGPEPRVQRPEKPRNVLFWLIDNARADRFRLYNPKSRVETPVITKLGERGTVFEVPYIVGTESRVSHASIWTAIYPRQHRFIGPKDKLASSWITMPEAIRAAGLFTAAWTANGNISARWGFGEGWDRFRNNLHEGGGLDGKALADQAISFIKERGKKPFFLYVGTIDPHVSWRGHEPWLSRYDPGPYAGTYKTVVRGPDWDRVAGNPERVAARDRQRIQAIYDSTISFNDQHLGRVIAALEEAGIRDQTMIIITADHGEEFWEHGRIGHGASLRDTVVKVPFIIDYPPLFGHGVRVREAVCVESIMPSILDALGAPIPPDVQAGSLLPLAQGVGRGYPRVAFASQYELAHAIRMEHLKLRVGGSGIPQVFDMNSAAAEAQDVARARPFETRWLTDALGTFLANQARWRESRWGVPSNHLPALPKDLESGTSPPEIRP